MWSHPSPPRDQISKRSARLLDRQAAGRRERRIPGPGPDEGKAVRESPFSSWPAPWSCTRPFRARRPRSRGVPAGSAPGRDQSPRPRSHSRAARRFLFRLDRSGGRQQRHHVRGFRECVEPGLRVRRRLSDDPVGGLGTEAELDPDAVVVGGADEPVERAQARRARVALVVAVEEAVLRVQAVPPRLPGTPRGK